MSEIKHISKATDEIISYIDKKRKGEIRELRTRWAKINKNMPIEWNSLYTIAGISGSGKSSFANELETSLFDYNRDEDFAVLSFNYEMLSSRQVGRKLSFKTSKTVSELYSKDSQNLNDEAFDYFYEKYCEDELSSKEIETKENWIQINQNQNTVTIKVVIGGTN